MRRWREIFRGERGESWNVHQCTHRRSSSMKNESLDSLPARTNIGVTQL